MAGGVDVAARGPLVLSPAANGKVSVRFPVTAVPVWPDSASDPSAATWPLRSGLEQPSLVSTPDTPNVRTTLGRTMSGAETTLLPLFCSGTVLWPSTIANSV